MAHVQSLKKGSLKILFFPFMETFLRDLYDIRKSQVSSIKAAKERVLNAFFSRAQPNRLFIDGKFVPPVNQPFS